MSELKRCSVCEAESPEDALVEFDGQLFCQYCLDHCTLVCDCCGRRIWPSDNYGTNDMPLCSSCYERDYTTCDNCGAVIRQEDARYHYDDEDTPLCRDCYARSCCSSVINDYFYKPDPVFYGEGPRYFGVELEIDEGGEANSSARRVLDIANVGNERIYCKHDGSLDDGFEIVTHPMSLDYHAHGMPWREVMAEAVRMGYTSHQARTCGLHVHVSRNAFGETVEAQEAAIARVLYFFEKNWDELLKFSRRTQHQLDRWAARYGYKDQPRELLDHAKKAGNYNRYTSVNLQNTDTIEFRIFRGTLKYNTLIATLQLVDRVCDVAAFLSDEEVKGLSWTTFVQGCRQPELIQCLKERRLYVNEPVDGEAEV